MTNKQATMNHQHSTSSLLCPWAGPLSLLLAMAGTASMAQAQQTPDAGQTLQQQLRTPVPPPRPARDIPLQWPQATPTQPGGPQIRLRAVHFSGNTVIGEAALQAVVADALGQPVDMAGLQALADQVSQHYRGQGYPFARAFLPPQPLHEGALRVEIIEGRYGQVKAIGDDPRLVAQAQTFLGHLQPGQVIQSAPLERSTLLLDEQPGIEISPLIRPGQALGTGDLEVRVQRTKPYSGDIGLDNHGNRYTGQAQAHIHLEASSMIRLGDQATLRTLVTDQSLWFGQIGYGLPLGASGLRGQLGYARSHYELGQDFTSLQAHGTADVASLGLSYPLLRSQRANVNLSGSYQHKALTDQQDAARTRSDKSSHTWPLVIGFDLRDGWGGGGITYGALSWTSGQLDLDDAQRAADALTARKQGHFGKGNLDLARIQALPGRLSLFGRGSAQWTEQNLDSSEGFGLGGPGGVRAYPTGEGFGDRGWVMQIELRHQTTSSLAPYAFYDAGGVTRNARPWTADAQQRRIAGAGAGVRFQQAGWHAEASVAWRSEGGPVESDTRQRQPTAWVAVAYRF